MNTTRLALIAHRFQHNDGQGRVNYEVACAALDRGYKVTMVAAHCAVELVSHPNASFVQFGSEKLPTQLLRNLAFASQTARWIRQNRHDFDLVQANGFITWEPCDFVTVHFVHTAWKKNLFYPFRDLWRPYHLYQSLFTALNSRWEKRAFRTAKRILTVSEVVAQEVHQCGVSLDRIKVIYNGVDTNEYHPGPSDRPSFGLPSDVPLALFVGEIRTPRKNLDTLLHAMQSVPRMHLAVAGETKDSPYVPLAQSLGLQDRVHFLGKTKRIADLMRSVDLFVFPSRYEAHPLVVLEAMASALPIIISANVGSAQSFSNIFAILDNPDDSAQLSRLIGECFDSPESSAAMGHAARTRALDLKWSQTVAKYLAAYETFLSTREMADYRLPVLHGRG